MTLHADDRLLRRLRLARGRVPREAAEQNWRLACEDYLCALLTGAPVHMIQSAADNLFHARRELREIIRSVA